MKGNFRSYICYVSTCENTKSSKKGIVNVLVLTVYSTFLFCALKELFTTSYIHTVLYPMPLSTF